MSERTHLAGVQLVKEDADRIAVCGDQEIRAVQDGLPHTGVLVLRGNDHKAPGRHVFQGKRVVGGKGIAAIAPGENRMLESVLPQAGRVVEVEFVAGGVAALRSDCQRDGPGACAVFNDWLLRSSRENRQRSQQPTPSGCRGPERYWRHPSQCLPSHNRA